MDDQLRAQDAFEEPLPYDIEQDVIKIEERDYGTFYIDTFDHKERYDGKTVEYDIMVVLSEKLPPNSFIAGRFIMNCCADDIQLFGFLADDTLGLKLKDRQWIHLKANISYEWSEEYNEEELQLVYEDATAKNVEVVFYQGVEENLQQIAAALSEKHV